MDTKNISWPGWETVKLIGRGSFGAVYEIQRDVLGDVEKAALKVISIPQHESDIDEMYSDGYDDESITSTFQNHLKSIVAEYTLMKKMSNSANIVHSDDIRYIQHENGFGWDIFIKMELLTPLTKALPADIPEETVLQLAKDMCTALELCRKHGIVHRDIKPQNIFLSPNGNYKLGDFGIAKTVEKTMGGTKIGTYKYMAPEVYNNQPYGMGADIYSLGLVLYWMLNERRMPFLPLPPEKLSSGMEERARNRRFSGEPLPPPAHGSADLKKIVLKACAFDPKERYQSAAEMLHDLNEGFGSEAVRRRKEEEQRRKEQEEQERLRKEREEQERLHREREEQARKEKEAQEEQERLQRELAEQERLRKEQEEKQHKEKEAQEHAHEEKKTTNNKKWIVAAALVVVCIICGVMFFTKGGKSNSTHNGSEQTISDVPTMDRQQSATERALIPDENVMSNTIATVELDLLSCADSISLDYDVSNQTCAVIDGSAVYGFSEAYVEIDIVNDYGTTYSFSPTDYIIRWDGSRVSIEPNGLPYGVYRITLRNSADQSEYAKFAFSYGFAGEVYLVDHKVDWQSAILRNRHSPLYLVKENGILRTTAKQTGATVFSADNPISTSEIDSQPDPYTWYRGPANYILCQFRVHGTGAYLYALADCQHPVDVYLNLNGNFEGGLCGHFELDETSFWLIEKADTEGTAQKNIISEQLKSAEVGDYVFFGKYEQDNNTSNGAEDIEWLVLDKEDGKILVISKYVLDWQKYDASDDCTWETCTLRQWLNDDFLNAAFSSDEKKMIPTVTVNVHREEELEYYHSYALGSATQDKVFLLSGTEAREYFGPEGSCCRPTMYARSKGAFASTGAASTWWWLRSAYTEGHAPCVSYYGGIDNFGKTTNNYGVRPAMWIELEN